MATTKPAALHFTGNEDADVLIATDPLALLIGFALDQQVSVQTAFTGPLKIKQRLGTFDAGAIAATDPARLDEVFRERPAIHRFPGNMARRTQELCAFVMERYDGRAERLWEEASDSDDLRRRIEELPGFGEMKVKALGSVLAKRFGVQVAEGLVPGHPTLGDVDSAEALEHYQSQKRAYKAGLRAQSSS
jgi:uncharacterized HhH-GPD family protein